MAFTPPEPGELLVDEPRFVLRGAPGLHFLQVQRVRLRAHDARDAVAEARGAMERLGASVAVWWLTDATASEVEQALLSQGLFTVEDDYLVDGLALASEPPPGPRGVEARAVATVDELVAARALSTEVFGKPADATDPARRLAEMERGGSERVYAAWVDGRMAGTARAYFSTRGAMMAGGATAEWARGRGAYRALVRARWDDAVARGVPLLGVHAKDTSSPILRRLGFEKVLQLRRLEDAVASPG